MRITFYKRKSFQYGNFSIERVFEDVRKALDPSISISVKESHFHTQGILKRIFNIIEAPFYQSDVNHITGDIHYIALLLKKQKTIITMHDCVILNRSKGLKRIILYLFWYWLPFKRALVTTTVSETAKQELLSYLKCSANNIIVINNPVSDIFKPNIKFFNSIKPIILQIGVSENKNIARLAEALDKIPCHLRIIGNPSVDQNYNLKKFNIDYSSVSSLSNEEIAEEYVKCDLLAFVSTYEGFGLPIVEAQATGRPVVTSNVSSMIEVAGESACLVNPFDIASIRNGFLKLIHDVAYREELIRKGFINVDRFRPANIAHQYSDLYRKIHLHAPINNI